MKKWYLIHNGIEAYVTDKKPRDPNVVVITVTADTAAQIMLLEKTANTKTTGPTIDEEEGV